MVKKRLLMIDNYDSFTWNLVHYLQVLGCEVITIRNDEITVPQIIELNPDSIVLSPGPSTPDEAGISLDVVDKLHEDYPILGICLGHQVIGQALGASITRAREPVHGKIDRISHDGRGLFTGTPDPLNVTRYHSLVINRETLPGTLVVSAWTRSKEIMGIRHRHLPLHGLQFHPEALLTDCGMQVLGNFISNREQQ
jgi:anthranilate synthase/aminodeoxychorismate synthase-like glutamine amidotransferase